MKKYIVSRTESENNYNYTGEWDSNFLNDYVEADSEEEAIEFAKDWIQEHGDEPENYIYRAEEKNSTYEAWVMINSDNDVITEEYETSEEALNEMLEKYTIEEMHENGFTLNKVLADDKSWLECLDEIDY